MYERPTEQSNRTWTGVQVLHKLAAPNRGCRSPATLAAVVDGADLGGRGGALAGVLGQQLLHPRQMGA
jgi:hypothetical protein